ncbi:MAG: RagB/SusD family nutrient uptake outer membrane protein [Prevotellaceae bacterium]|nr:RagB/SusD family nutrient uptake outer membrane protein [Prevotellaceae bacterium]
MKKNYKNIFTLLFVAAATLTSCVDTVILPDDKTVDEDFWKTKDDVSYVVNKAYQSMLSTSFMQNIIVWSDFRSDELDYVSSISGNVRNALEEISAAKIETDNMFNDWAPLYSTINYCNIVLEKSEGVMAYDPNYSSGDFKSDCSQMLALRALCYFYLVRVFRDVPVTPGAYMNSSQELNLAQTAPLTVIDQCIADLKTAEQNALQASNYQDWRKVGYINNVAIQAMLADFYLWRASVMHSEADYRSRIEYCDKVIAAKQEQFVPRPGQIIDEKDIYHLANCSDYYTDMYGQKNCYESIFELQFDGNNNSNTGLCNMYHKIGTNSTTPYLRVPMSTFGRIGQGNIFESTLDQRAYNSVYSIGGTADFFDVRKMIHNLSAPQGKSESRTEWTYEHFSRNWIVYRLTDVMLMKAEALVQLTQGDNENPMAEQAFSLVQAVNTRALPDKSKSDSLKWNTYKSQDLELLVLNERARELCFEGKRWFDLLRYNYRHVDGVDYTTTLAAQDEQKKPFVANYSEMMNLMVKEYATGGQTIKYKMPTEPYLYMPVLQSQIDVNTLLVQNPVYSENSLWKKD